MEIRIQEALQPELPVMPLSTELLQLPFPQDDESSILPPPYFAEDEEWLKKVEFQIRENMSNNHFTIMQLADAVAISERQLRRRLKKLLGLRPWQYLTRIRLEYARQLLEQKKYKTLTQTAYAVGYRDVDSFRKNFKKIYDESPIEYLR